MANGRRFDHVGITVADLDIETAFFVGLGLEVLGRRMIVENEVLDHDPGSPAALAYVRGPEGIFVSRAGRIG